MHFNGKKSENIIAFMVRYLSAPRLRQAGLTMNGKSNGCSVGRPFALRPTCRLQGAGQYRRVNGTFCRENA